MRIGVAVGWPFRYSTCWVELGSSESDSNWTFFFFIAFSSEEVEETDDPTPVRKLVLFSSSDELGSYPLRRLARSSAEAISSGVLSSSEMTSSSSGWLDSLYRGFKKLVDWEVLTSLGTEVLVVFEGLSSVLFHKYEWDLVERAWGLLLLDGMILTKSNIQRQRGWNTPVKCEAIHYENDVYRDANYAKQKQKQMSACLQLNMDEDEGKVALNPGCWLAVGKMSAVSERCPLVAPFQMTFNKLLTSIKTILLNFLGWDFRCRQIGGLETLLTQKNRTIPELAKKGYHENRISGFQNEHSRWILNNSLPEAFKWQIWTDTE